MWGWTQSKDAELDKFKCKLQLLTAKNQEPLLYPHLLINTAKDLVLDTLKDKPTDKDKFALTNKKLWVVAELLDVWLKQQKNDANATDNEGNTPLHILCILCAEAANLGSGLSAWEKREDKTGYETCTLSHPIAYMFIKLLKITNINLQNAPGNAPLHIIATASSEHFEFNAHNLLLAQGARTDILNIQGKTPMDIAAAYAKDAVLLECVRLYNNDPKTWQQIAKENMIQIEDYRLHQNLDGNHLPLATFISKKLLGLVHRK